MKTNLGNGVLSLEMIKKLLSLEHDAINAKSLKVRSKGKKWKMEAVLNIFLY